MNIFLAERITEVILNLQKQGIEGRRTHSCIIPPIIQA
jgi:hypothetical protein